MESSSRHSGFFFSLLLSMSVRFTHEVVCISGWLFFIAGWYSIVWMYHNVGIYFTVNGCWGSELGALINVQIKYLYRWIFSFFWNICLEVEFLLSHRLAYF